MIQKHNTIFKKLRISCKKFLPFYQHNIFETFIYIYIYRYVKHYSLGIIVSTVYCTTKKNNV